MKATPALVTAAILLMGLLSGCLSEQVEVPSAEPYLIPATGISDQMSGEERLLPEERTEGGLVGFVPGQIYRAGDQVLISGTTILSPENPLLVEVLAVPFGPTKKTDTGYFSGVSAVIEVTEGKKAGENMWSYLLNTSGFAPGEYTLEVTGLKVKGFHQTAMFSIVAP